MKVAIVLANQTVSNSDLSHSALAEVGALPLVLRAIVTTHAAQAPIA